MNSGGNSNMRRLFLLVCICLNLPKGSFQVRVRLIFKWHLIDAIFDEDYHVMIALSRVHAHHIALKHRDSASVEEVFVSCRAKRLLALEIILRKCSIGDLRSYLIELEC